MSFLPFKKEADLPDNYGVKLFYLNGNKDEFELASHRIDNELKMFEFVTKDDFWNWIPLSSIARVEFDKRFSKIVAEKEKLKRAV